MVLLDQLHTTFQLPNIIYDLQNNFSKLKQKQSAAILILTHKTGKFSLFSTIFLFLNIKNNLLMLLPKTSLQYFTQFT